MRQGAHRGRGLLYGTELRNRNVQKLIAPIMFLSAQKYGAWDGEKHGGGLLRRRWAWCWGKPGLAQCPTRGAGLFELAGPRSIEVLGRTLPLADSNNSSAHFWRRVTTSSRAKVPPAGAVLALDLNAEQLNSLGFEVQQVPSRALLTLGVRKWPEHASEGSSYGEALRRLAM